MLADNCLISGLFVTHKTSCQNDSPVLSFHLSNSIYLAALLSTQAFMQSHASHSPSARFLLSISRLYILYCTFSYSKLGSVSLTGFCCWSSICAVYGSCRIPNGVCLFQALAQAFQARLPAVNAVREGAGRAKTAAVSPQVTD